MQYFFFFLNLGSECSSNSKKKYANIRPRDLLGANSFVYLQLQIWAKKYTNYFGKTAYLLMFPLSVLFHCCLCACIEPQEPYTARTNFISVDRGRELRNCKIWGLIESPQNINVCSKDYLLF